MIDDPLSALFEDDEPARVQLLAEFDQLVLPDQQWLRTPQYFHHTLGEDGYASLTEQWAAIEAAVSVPVLSVRRIVEHLAEAGPTPVRAAAAVALARAGAGSAGETIVGIVDEAPSLDVRQMLAESLLLVDVQPVRERVEELMEREEDAGVRMLLAGSYCNAGGAVDPDYIGLDKLPDSMSRRVEIGESGDGHKIVRVDPVVETIPKVRFIDGVHDFDGPAGQLDPAAVERTAGSPEAAPPAEVHEPASAGNAPTRAGQPQPPDDPQPDAWPQHRYLHTRAPAAAVLDETVPVMVRVALEQPDVGAGTAFDLDVPPEGTAVRAVVSADSFDILGPTLQPLPVPHAEDSPWILFDLVGRAVGTHLVTVSLFAEKGRQLAESTHEIVVTPTAVSTAIRDSRASMSALAAAAGETSLLIDWLPQESRYRFQLIDEEFPDEVISDVYSQNPRELVETLAGQLNEIANGGERPQNLRRWMQDLGTRLWSEMIPNELKSQFWEREERITSLRIIAQRDPFPWELLYPSAVGRPDQSAFLVERFPVLRGVRGRGPATSIGEGPVVTVVPAVDAPPAADDEAALVRSKWSKVRASSAHVTDMSSLRALIDSGSFGVLHFACHNIFDASSADGSTITFADDRFTPLALAGSESQRSFESSRPLVFMNACRAGAQAPCFTRIGGWAGSFVRSGAGAFIGPHWNVRDESSAGFSDAFYDQLTNGATLADAVRVARSSIISDSDPTWLAYAVYGDPSATLATQ